MNEIVVVFPGQGSQYDGMGKTWYDEHASVRERFAEASELLGYSLEELCFRAPAGEITRTHYAQASIMVISFAMYEVLQRVQPFSADWMTGHSLGELTALAAAGAITFSDTVRLVKARGEAMERCAKASRTGMVAVVGPSSAEVEAMIEDVNGDSRHIQVANYNNALQTVVGGTIEEIEALCNLLDDNGTRYTRLNVAGAFHTSHMAGALAEYTAVLDAIDIQFPRTQILSSVTGRRYESSGEIRKQLATQITSPVRWHDVVTALRSRDVQLWIECGPKRVLANLIGSAVGEDRVASVESDFHGACQAVEGVVTKRSHQPSFVGLCLGAVAATRNRNFDSADYATGVLDPHRQLQELAGRHNDPHLFTNEEKLFALQLLRTILHTKRVPVDEQEERVGYILRRSGDLQLEG